MSVTLLVSALKADVDELIAKMNISSDAVIVNQCDENGRREVTGEHRLAVISSTERGVGVSRNLCIANAFGDISLFSDDDIVYDAGYAEMVSGEFNSHPEADLITFNVDVCEERRTYHNDIFKKLNAYNIGRYPAYSIAVRTAVLKEKALSFSPLFGGGAKYSNGEDSLFLKEALKKGVRMYASPVKIAREEPRPSTWFEGYTEKFFFDRGVLFAFLYGNAAFIWRIRFLLTKKEMFTGKITRREAGKLIKAGIREGRKIKKENV